MSYYYYPQIISENTGSWAVPIILERSQYLLRPLSSLSSAFGLFSESGICIRSFFGHTMAITCCVVYREDDGTVIIVTGDEHGELRRWSATTGLPKGNPIKARNGSVTCCETYQDTNKQTIIVAGYDTGALRCWNTNTEKQINQKFMLHSEPIICCATYIQNGKSYIVTGSYDRTLLRWDPETGLKIGTPLRHPEIVNCCMVYQQNNGSVILVSGDQEGNLFYWNAQSGDRFKNKCRKLNTPINCCHYYQQEDDTGVIVVGDLYGNVYRFNASTGEIIEPTIKHHSELIFCTSYKTNHKKTILVTGCLGGTILLWDARSGGPLNNFSSDKQQNSVVCATHYQQKDGNTIVATGNKSGLLQCWNLLTGKPVGSALKLQTSALDPAFNKVTCCDSYQLNGDTIIIAGNKDGQLRRWNTHTQGMLPDVPRGHNGDITCCINYTENNTVYIITGSNDSTLRIIDAQTDQYVGGPLTGHKAPITNCVSYTQNNEVFVLSSDESGLAIYWQVRAGIPIKKFTKKNLRNITSCTSATIDEQAYFTFGTSCGLVYQVNFSSSFEVEIISNRQGKKITCSTTHELADGSVNTLYADTDRKLYCWNNKRRFENKPLLLPATACSIFLVDSTLVVQLEDGNRMMLQWKTEDYAHNNLLRQHATQALKGNVALGIRNIARAKSASRLSRDVRKVWSAQTPLMWA